MPPFGTKQPFQRNATVGDVAAHKSDYHVSWSSGVLTSCRTGVSKPSVNQP